jgi:threonine aldolase
MYEGAGHAAVAGAQVRPIPNIMGIFDGKAVDGAFRDPAVGHHPRSRVVAIEQTMNLGGGAVWSLDQIADVAAAARRHKLILHMDGARLPNAVVMSGVSAAKMCASCDTTWLDLSKGLGCPIGGVLAGSRDFIAEAWRWKHRMGGALRQSGILAAAGLYALDHNWDRLVEDHANAKMFAAAVKSIPGIKLIYDRVDTNLVFLDCEGTGRTAAEISAAVMTRNVRIGAMGPMKLRAVTHLDVSKADVEKAAAALREVVAGH